MNVRSLKILQMLIAGLLITQVSKSQTIDSLKIVSVNERLRKQTIMLFLVPQYVMVDGIRADIEIRGKTRKAWWVISPYYYHSNENSINIMTLFKDDMYYDEYNYNELKGVGLGISRKHFLTNNSSEKGFHLKYGGVYRFYNVFGSTPSYQEFVGEDNLTYLQLEETAYTLLINHIQLKAEIGYQYQSNLENLFFDFYMGFATSFGLHDSPQNIDLKFDRSKIDYGYSGISFIAGFRIGLKL